MGNKNKNKSSSRDTHTSSSNLGYSGGSVHNSGSSSTSRTSSQSWSGSAYSGGSYASYSNNKPKKAFEVFGIEFWGSPKTGLDKIYFEEGDLIINCTGTSWTPKPPPPKILFVKEMPEWLKVPEIFVTKSKHNFGELAQQIILDWPDMSPPPIDADIQFWSEIIEQSKANNIKRIICCCMAGQGRTGTALSALLLASGEELEPDKAIEYIREVYNPKAVETNGQEDYLFQLIYEVDQ